jgi:hypothetical protein
VASRAQRIALLRRQHGGRTQWHCEGRVALACTMIQINVIDKMNEHYNLLSQLPYGYGCTLQFLFVGWEAIYKLGQLPVP